MLKVAKFPALRLVEKASPSGWSETSTRADRREYALLIRESIEEELADIKAWAPEGSYVVEVVGRKPQLRWPDPVKKDRKGKPRIHSTVKFSLKERPQMERNRIDRYRLLAELKAINELIGKQYK